MLFGEGGEGGGEEAKAIDWLERGGGGVVW